MYRRTIFLTSLSNVRVSAVVDYMLPIALGAKRTHLMDIVVHRVVNTFYFGDV